MSIQTIKWAVASGFQASRLLPLLWICRDSIGASSDKIVRCDGVVEQVVLNGFHGAFEAVSACSFWCIRVSLHILRMQMRQLPVSLQRKPAND